MDDGSMAFEEVRQVVVRTLGIESRAASLSRDTSLLDGIPEFDSMAVMQVTVALEERFGFTIHDEEMTADIFETLGSLTDFVESKLA